MCSTCAPSLVAALLSARAARRQGIRAIPANERTEILTTVALHRSVSLDLAEREIAENRMAVHVPQGELLMPEIPSFSDNESVGIVDLWS
tara:strand:+ start:541 stop:810 length:270 start_codon:yes stop_codon:yes gene_type:complete